MNILIDIAHPAHVHLIRNFYREMIARGHKLTVTVKEIPSAISLLNFYSIPYISLGGKSDSIIGKAFLQLKLIIKLISIVKREKIEVSFGSSLSLAQLTKILRIPSIILDDDDDDVEPLFVKYAHSVCTVVLSPDCVVRKTNKVIRYAGYHELAYLHPNRFKPDKSVLEQINIGENEKFFVLRFNAFKAHHDSGVAGISIENKRKLIRLLEKYGKVVITTERDIDPEFQNYQLKISQDKIHSLLFYSALLIGESQTMTSEAAVLGVPSIRCNSLVGRLSCLNEEEFKYDLTYGFLPEDSELMFERIIELINNEDIKQNWKLKRQFMLSNKIDVTSFFIWFVESFPESVRIMHENPDYMVRFNDKPQDV